MALAATLSLLPLAAPAQEDKDRITRFLEDNLSGAGRQVLIEGFRGALSSRATMERMTIADGKGVWLSLDNVVLDWNRLAVLRGNISINELSAETITVLRAPEPGEDAIPSPEAPGFSLPELPVSVNIGRIGANRISLDEALFGQAVIGTLEASAALAGGEGRISLVLDRQDGPTGRIALDASYANSSTQLIFSLDAAEDAGGLAATMLGLPGTPATELTIKGAGPLTAFAADLRLATDGAERLAGQVEVRGTGDGGRRFAADIGGDIAPVVLPAHADFFGREVRVTANGVQEAGGRLDLSSFELTARSLALNGQVTVGPDGHLEKVDVRGRLADPDGGAVLLPVSASDPTRVRTADLTLAYDIRSGEGWSASATAVAVQRNDVQIAGLALKGSGRISRAAGGNAPPVVGGSFAFAAEGLAPTDPAVAAATGPRLSGTLSAFWQPGSGVVNVGKLALKAEDYGAEVSGRVAGLETGLAMQGKVTGQAADLSRFSGLAGNSLQGRGELALEGTGSPLGGDFDVTGVVTGTDLGAGIAELDNLLRGQSSVAFALRRDATGTTLRDLTVQTQTGAHVQARGTLATVGSDVSAELTLPDLAALGGAYSGSLSGNATFSGTPAAGRATLKGRTADLRVGNDEIDGLLRGAGTLDLDVSFQGDAVSVTLANVTTAQVQADVRGTFAPANSDLSATFSLPDVGVMGAGYRGSLRADATFRGTTENARLQIAGTGRDLAIGQPEVDGLLRGETGLDVAATVAGARVALERAAITNPQVRLQLSGTYDPAGSDLTADVALPSLVALGRGYGGSVQVQARYEGTPQSGRIALDGSGRDISVSQPEADRLFRGDSTIRLRAGLAGGRLQIDEARLRTAQIDAQANGSVTENRRQLNINARLTNLAVLLPEFPGPLSVEGSLDDDGSAYALDLRARGPGGIDATAKGQVATSFRTANLSIDGTAQAGLANVFLGDRAISGQVGFDLLLNGPLALSSLSGPVRLTGGRLSDPDLPFSLTDMSATATLGGGVARIVSETAVTSGGRISTTGTVGMTAPYSGDLAIQVLQLGLRDPQLYQTVLDAGLRVSGPLTGGALISGEVGLGPTELRVPSTGLGGTGDLPGLRHVNEPGPVLQTRRRAGLLGEGSVAGAAGDGGSGRFGLDLLIRARNQIFIRGRGLEAELAGDLRLGGTTAAVIASGGFELIRGRLDILGKRLVLDRANITLEGDLMPRLDISASNSSNGVTSSVVIEGRADAPEVSFQSTPALPEDEVLAQLLFGQGLDNLSAFQALQLASAVATLAGRGGDGIVGRLRKGFGLDDLDVSTAADGESTVRAGKYLSRNVYTEVEVEGGGKSKVNLNLDLHAGLTARGSVDSDGEASLGLFLERDY